MSDQSPRSPQSDPRPDESRGSPSAAIDMARAERLLSEGDIEDVQGIMRWGSNYAALVTIRDAELAATAVYKPQRGERPLWDFPDGTLCYREVVAYIISEALEWHLVPPTVLRVGPHGLGSLQLFIDHDPEINYFSLDDQFVPQLHRFVVFDDLINNADRKGGHLLLDERGKLWGIDHGLALNAMPKLRTVIWEFAGHPIPRDLLAPVQKLLDQLATPSSDLRTRIDPLIAPEEVDALQKRANHLLDCRQFPQPGPGPNYPWPPV